MAASTQCLWYMRSHSAEEPSQIIHIEMLISHLHPGIGNGKYQMQFRLFFCLLFICLPGPQTVTWQAGHHKRLLFKSVPLKELQ